MRADLDTTLFRLISNRSQIRWAEGRKEGRKVYSGYNTGPSGGGVQVHKIVREDLSIRALLVLVSPRNTRPLVAQLLRRTFGLCRPSSSASLSYRRYVTVDV